ncbi:hypothetical protein AAII07_56505 [Microvirga sp. 0TCS3.31]|jgi:hypothetical protein
MHIPMHQPDLLAPHANLIEVRDDYETGERIVYDPSQNTGCAHVAGSKVRDGSGESVWGLEHISSRSPPNAEAQAQS